MRPPLTVRGRDLPLRYRVEGPFVREGAPHRPLFLLVVKGSTPTPEQRRHWRRRREPAFYLVNAVRQADGTWAPPLPAAELLAWAWQRWEVEVAHRAMKSDAGVGAVQCWHPHATVRAVQWQAWAYAVCVLAGYRAWGYDPRLGLRPPPRRGASRGPVVAGRRALECGHALARLSPGLGQPGQPPRSPPRSRGDAGHLARNRGLGAADGCLPGHRPCGLTP
jgi:hypothetical protein